MHPRKIIAVWLAALLTATAAAGPAEAALAFGTTRKSQPPPSVIIKPSAPTAGTPSADAPAYTGSHPYPSLMDFTDLESSFLRLAAPKILDSAQSYVLAAIKYHIASDADDYRVSRALVSDGGNLVFFFEGCSRNLSGAVIGSSGFYKGSTRYNTSAVCLLVQRNGSGRAEITFVSGDASTLPDNVRDTSINDGYPIPTVKDGIYRLTTINNNGSYASLHLDDPLVVRCSESGNTTLDTYMSPRCDDINIHMREMGGIDPRNIQSIGCIAMENTYSSNYFSFIEKATHTVLDPSCKFSASFLGRDEGLVIIDRTPYKVELATIYGSDNIRGGLTGAEIAAKITETSAVWNSAIGVKIPARSSQSQTQDTPSGGQSQSPAAAPSVPGNTRRSSGGIVFVKP